MIRLGVVALALSLVVGSFRARAQATETSSGVSELHLRRSATPRAEDFETARLVGTGYGMRAGAFGTSAVLVNPANLPLSQQYHVEGFVQYVPNEGSVSFGSVVADSSTNRIRAGLASRAIFGNGDHDYRGSESRLALGTGFGEHIGIGVGLRYLHVRARHETNDGYPTALELRAITLDASARVTPITGLHIAALGYNLIRTGNLLAPTQLGGSVVYQYQTAFQAGGDVLVDLTTFTRPTVLWGFATEISIRDHYPVRLGFRRDQGRRINAMSVGLGFIEQRYGIELSLRQEFGVDRQSVLFVSARYALDMPPQQPQ